MLNTVTKENTGLLGYHSFIKTLTTTGNLAAWLIG